MYLLFTAQNMKFSIKDFFGKCDQIHSFVRIWSHLLKKSLMENFIFCAVHLLVTTSVYYIDTPNDLDGILAWCLQFW